MSTATEKTDKMVAAMEKRALMGLRATAADTLDLIAAYREMEKKAYLKIPVPRWRRKGW